MEQICTNDIYCCFCGKGYPGEDFDEHFNQCSKTSILNQKFSSKRFPHFYNLRRGHELANKKAREFHENYNKFCSISKNEKPSMTTIITLISSLPMKSHGIKNLEINCIKCLQKLATNYFPRHILTCFLIEIKDNPYLLMIVHEMLKQLILIENNTKEDEAANLMSFFYFLMREYDSFAPLVTENEIFCYICGEILSKENFETHYNICKKTYENSSNKIVEEPDILYTLINKIQNKEKLTKENLKEYSEKARDVFRWINMEKCVKCGRNVSPNSFSFHITNCTSKRKALTDHLNKLNGGVSILSGSSNVDKTIRNRKRSMQHLKNITSEEIKHFKKFNYSK